MEQQLPLFCASAFTNHVLQNPPSTLTPPEQFTIQEVFATPVTQKYLNILLWNAIRDLASIPITEAHKEEYQLRHAYAKGCIGMLTTLLSIKKEK